MEHKEGKVEGNGLRKGREEPTAVATAWWEGIEKRKPFSAQRCTATG